MSSTTSLSTLDYEAPRHRRLRRQDKRRLGVASCTCWGIAVAIVGLILFVTAVNPSAGREDVRWLAAGVLIAWSASIVGTILGMRAALPLHLRGEFALAGLILNLMTSLCPFALCILSGGPPC